MSNEKSAPTAKLGTFPDDEYVFSHADHLQWNLQGLDEIRKDEHFCDVTLCVGDQTFSAHRIVLSAFSGYFKAMFLGNLAESRQDVVTLNGVDSDTFSLILNYAYTSTITINSSNVQSLLSASNFLEVMSVKGACARFIERQLDNSNCITVHNFAGAYACSDLARTAKEHLLKNFSLATKCKEWLGLPLNKIVQFLEDDNLVVEREEMVYQAATEWLHRDFSARSLVFYEVLECVKLPLVSSRYLYEVVGLELAVRSSFECLKLIDKAKTCQLLPHMKSGLNIKRAMPRKDYSDTITGIVTFSGYFDYNSIKIAEFYNPIDFSCSTLAAPPVDLCGHQIVVSEDNLFYAAGRSSFWPFDPISNEWSELAPMLTKRSMFALAIVDGLIYAVGGYCFELLDSVECYNPNTNNWKDVGRCCETVNSVSVTTYQGQVYIFGGDGLTDVVQVFDPINNTCKRISPLIEPSLGSAAACINGCVYLIGGILSNGTVTSKVEKYDPHTERWTWVASMKEKRGSAGVAVERGRAYVLGGWDGTNDLSSVECYEPDSDHWTTCGEMILPQAGLSCGVLKIKRNLLKPFDITGPNKVEKTIEMYGTYY